MTCETYDVMNHSVRFTAPVLRRFVTALLLSMFLATSSLAWSNPGHMAVAAAAYRQLDPDTRARVDTLIALNPKVNFWKTQIPSNVSAANKRMRLFMIAATWADQIKSPKCPQNGPPTAGCHIEDGLNGGNTPPSDGSGSANLGYSDKNMRKYWHFVDIAFSPDQTPFPSQPPVPNAETQIDAFRSVLASNADDELKSFDLVWLLHLVGDVHQPLHCTARYTQADSDGDDGGNGVKVNCSPSCAPKLHSFWDGLFGSTQDLKEGVRIAINVADGLPTAPAAAVNDLNTAHWIQEGFALAKAKAYKNPPIKNGTGPYTITASYRNSAITEGNKRVALAGARLAKILNDELR